MIMFKPSNIFKATIIILLVSSGLISIGYPQAEKVNILIQELKDTNPDVRSKAALELGEIKNPRAVDPLIAALNDKDLNVRQSAARALGEIKDPRAVEPLIVATKDKDYNVRYCAAMALGEIRDVRASAFLIAALKDEKLEIIGAASSFFIQKGISGSEPVLIKAVDKHGYDHGVANFLNSGNPKLEEAGRRLANKKAYKIIPVFGKKSPKWGESK